MEGVMKAIVKNAKTALSEPDNYEARGNLLWAAPWAMNGLFAGGSRQMWSCHPIEHELSARFDITHGLGLAIIMPRWLRFCLSADPQTETKICEFGKNVFGAEGAQNAIEAFENFLFKDLQLSSSLSEIGLGDIDCGDIAKTICKNGAIKGYCTLDEENVKSILDACK